jgi:uncharacterized repeat protein (TIGR03803 family)
MYPFSGPDGQQPLGLTFGSNFDLYGVTVTGGRHNCGTLFKVTPAGALTTLHHFSGADGMFPSPGLVFDNAGNLYGTTQHGGAANAGVIFQFSPGGVLQVLASFPAVPPGAAAPSAGVIFDNLGNACGMTKFGGANYVGAIFELIAPNKPNPALATLCSFTAGSGSPWPTVNPVFDTFGRLYGTTASVGANNLGTVFQLLPVAVGGKLIQIHSFSGLDGAFPLQLLVQETGSGPNPSTTFLYGATWGGGAANLGTVFRLEIP